MLLVLLLLIALIAFFTWDKISPDAVILGALIVLIVSKILTPSEAFTGFGSDFIIMLACIFIITASLQYNGVVDYMSYRLSNIKTDNYFILITIIMLTVGLLSAFMNNTSVAAVMVLPLVGFCQRKGVAPSRFLMPMAFASLLGGTCTLIGTSTNIAGNNFLVANGLPPLSMFELFPIGITLLLICTFVFAAFGNKILPHYDTEASTNNNPKRFFHAHFKAKHTTMLIGKKVIEIEKRDDIVIENIYNNGKKQAIDSNYIIDKDDNIYIKAGKEQLYLFYNKYQIEKYQSEEVGSEVKIAELMVLTTSNLVNNTIHDSQFVQQTGLTPIGIFRKGYKFVKDLEKIIIKNGDLLIVKGNEDDIHRIIYKNDLILLSQVQRKEFPNLRKGVISLVVFLSAIILGALGILPLSITFLLAALIVLSLKALPFDSAYTHIDWKLIILIGGMTAFGTAIKKTGADVFLAAQIVEYAAHIPPIVILFALMVLTVLLTQPMSNAAAALVVLPIALQTATKLNVEPRIFAIAIILSASVSMVTPFEPASLLVLGPGKYKISDFFKIGGILTLICLATILLFLYQKMG